MKFLYVASERQAAEMAALALRSVGPDVAVSWAAGLGQARRWIDENRNVSALIVEVESDTRNFEALITHARGVGVKVPVIGIPLIGTSEVLMSVGAVADEVVPRNATFLDALPQAVSRTLHLTKPQVQQISVPPRDEHLQRQLRDTEAVAARAEQRAQEALDQLRAREESQQAAIEQERAVRSEFERRLADAEAARQEAEAAHRAADRRRVREAATFAEDLSRRDMQLADATTLRQGLEEKLTHAVETQSLEQELAEAKRILRLADQLHATTTTDAESRIRDIQEQTDARLAEAASVTSALQRELADTVVALRSLERTSSAQRGALGRQLADQEAARQLAEQQAAADRQAAAEQLAKQAEGELAHRNAIQTLKATRQDLDARLVAAHDARRQLEEQHASAMAAVRAALETAEQRATKQQTDAAAAAQALETTLAESVANADRLRAQLSETALALTHAEQQAAADREAAGEQIATQQATFDSALAQEVIRRRKLDSQLAESDLAHRNAIQTLEATRQDLDARLVAAHDARRQLEEQHASAMADAREALEIAEQRANTQQTDAAAAAQALETTLAESVANADRLRAQLSDAALALTHAEQHAAADRQAAAEQVATQAESDLTHRNAIQALEATRQDLDARLVAAHDVRRQLEQQHASAMAAARRALEIAEQRANKQQTDAAAAAQALETTLADSVANADRLRAQLSDAALALTHAEQHAAADRQAAAEQVATQAESDLTHRNAIQALEATRQDLDARLVAAHDVRRQLEQQHASAMAAARRALEIAEQRANKQQTDAAAAAQALETTLADSVANADRLRAQLSETALALTTAEQQGVNDRQAWAEETQHHAAELAAAEARYAAFRTEAHSHLAEAAIGTDALRKELSEAAADRKALEAQLADEKTARKRVDQQHASAINQAAARLAEHQQQADVRATQAASALSALQAKLVEQAAALLETERQANSDRHAAAEHAAQRQAKFDTELAQEVGRRQNVAAKLTEAETAQRKAASDHAAAMAAAREQLSQHQQEAESRHAELTASLQTLEIKLAHAIGALQIAETQAANDRQAAAEKAASEQAEFEASLARQIANTQAIVKQLAEHETARQLAQNQHQSEIESGRRQLAEAKQEAEARLTETTARATKIEAQLADSTAALKRAHEQAARDRQVAAQQTAERRAEFEIALAHEVANRQALDTQLFEERGARQRAEAQYTTDLATARDQFASYQQKSESTFAETQQQHASAIASAEAMLAEHRRNAEAELAEYQHQADAQLREQQQHADARLTEHKQRADARLAEATANAAATLEASLQQAAGERQAAADRFALQQDALEASLAQEVARREGVESALTALQTASAEAERRFVDGIAAMRQQAAEHDTRLQERAAKERSEWEATLADRHQRIGQLEMDGELARQSIAASQAQIQQLEAANADLRAKLSALHQTFEQAKATAQQSLEALSRDHASERTRFQGIVAERDGQLHGQATRYQVANEAAAKAMADVEHRLRAALEGGQRDTQAIKQLEQQIAALGNDLEALNRQREELKTQADHVPVLRKVIDETQAEYRLRFDHTPIGMWRSSRDGTIVQANQALVSLLRYATVDDLLDVSFSTTVFESADELQWLVDRCLASRATETVETTWRRNDGVGIVVRLMAIATSSEAVDFVAMDITMLRTLEEKLRNSQRMEAVARYASEVAVTCDKLLGQVHQQGQQWLTRIESDSARHQGALLLDDVTRAAGFLRQLTVYGMEQKNAPELVDVKQVLRDLEPVLKRVAGSHVELVMPKTPSQYNLDVEIERFERILVNVAAYGRERMPFGGRLMIEVSAVKVDRTFVAKYPNVRPGAHVLLTVTEKKGATSPDWSTTVRDQASGAQGSAPPTQKPGVDLGALQALVSDCGGHLWIMAEPSGNMELRIHLPRRVLDDRTPAKKKAGRRGWMGKLAGARN